MAIPYHTPFPFGLLAANNNALKDGIADVTNSVPKVIPAFLMNLRLDWFSFTFFIVVAGVGYGIRYIFRLDYVP